MSVRSCGYWDASEVGSIPQGRTDVGPPPVIASTSSEGNTPTRVIGLKLGRTSGAVRSKRRTGPVGCLRVLRLPDRCGWAEPVDALSPGAGIAAVGWGQPGLEADGGHRRRRQALHRAVVSLDPAEALGPGFPFL